MKIGLWELVVIRFEREDGFSRRRDVEDSIISDFANSTSDEIKQNLTDPQSPYSDHLGRP